MAEDEISLDDPCKRAAQLKAIYYRLISGTSEASVKYTGNGVSREMSWNIANLTMLKAEIREAEEACAATGGEQPRRRYAIAAGSRRIIG